MLFNLLLASITILLRFFFLFRVDFNNFFTTSVKIENERLKIALAIPTSVPITVANDETKMVLVATDKTFNVLSN